MAKANGTDGRQSPIGFYLLGLSYFDGADKLAALIEDPAEAFRLRFDLPVRHLYAHGWELCLKACLFEQGTPPGILKSRYGHSLMRAWRDVDRQRFKALNLKPELEIFLTRMDKFHPTKLYAYPVTGYRNENSLTFIRATTERFRIDRATIAEHFSAHAPRASRSSG